MPYLESCAWFADKFVYLFIKFIALIFLLLIIL